MTIVTPVSPYVEEVQYCGYEEVATPGGEKGYRLKVHRRFGQGWSKFLITPAPYVRATEAMTAKAFVQRLEQQGQGQKHAMRFIPGKVRPQKQDDGDPKSYFWNVEAGFPVGVGAAVVPAVPAAESPARAPIASLTRAMETGEVEPPSPEDEPLFLDEPQAALRFKEDQWVTRQVRIETEWAIGQARDTVLAFYGKGDGLPLKWDEFLIRVADLAPRFRAMLDYLASKPTP